MAPLSTPARLPLPTPARSRPARAGLALAAALLCAAPVDAQLTRAQALAALTDPGSGVALDPATTVGWSPLVDFGFGTGFEGQVPVGTAIEPWELGSLPFPGPGPSVSFDAYFVFLDDEPGARFQHPVRYALIDAGVATPTVGNGGIVLSDQGWWPLITAPGDPTLSVFDTVLQRSSAFPASDTNPDGLVFGSAPDPAGFDLAPPPAAGPFPPPAGNPCGLIAMGPTGSNDPDFDFSGDLQIFENDLKNHYGVPDARIQKANGGAAASKQDLCDAIDAVAAADPPCDKIYVRISAHGSDGSISLSDGALSAAELCEKFKTLAAKGVPISLLIEACHSGSLLDAHNWNFPAGSTIITTAGKDECSWGGAFTPEGGGAGFSASLYPKAHSECLNDTTDTDGDGKVDADTNKDGTVDDAEAHAWVLKQTPCYTWNGNGENYYPAGPPTGQPGDNPGPTITPVGTNPSKLNINVCNGTGAPKTGFHMIFKGDVREGFAPAWRSDAGDHLGSTWPTAGGDIIRTYDREKDETMVCWEDPTDPILPGQYVHFGYYPPHGTLRPVRQSWAPTADPPDDPDKAPGAAAEATPSKDGSTLNLRVTAFGEPSGGFGVPASGLLLVRTSPTSIPIEHLSLADPLVQSLPQVALLPVNLLPDVGVDVELPMPSAVQPTDHLVVQLQLQWSLNTTTISSLSVIDPVEPGPWTGLGQGLAGTLGEPLLTGSGTLTGGSPNAVEIANGPTLRQAHLVMSLALLQAPFKGGTLVPFPDVLVPGLPLNGDGGLYLPFVWAPGIPPGIPFYSQFWIPDPGAPKGFAATNGLQGVSQ